jgi:hypothetical protein
MPRAANTLARSAAAVLRGALLAGAVTAGAQPFPLGPEFRANTQTLDNQEAVSVAARASGDFVAAWHSFQQDGSSWGIYAQRFGPAGEPLGPEFRVNSHTTNRQLWPSVATSRATGGFVVVWQGENQDGSTFGIFGQRHDAAGAPQGGEFQVNTFTTGDQSNPAVAVDDAGNFVVVWQSADQDGSAFGIFGRRYDSAGVAQGGEFRANTFTTGEQILPAVAADGAGRFVVAWQSLQDGGGYGIFGQRYDSAGAAQGGEFRVNTYTTFSQGQPEAAAFPAGGFVVVWEGSGQDGEGAGVFGQRYDSAGAAQGAEFRANAYTTGSQALPSVAADASGGFVVVWDDTGRDGAAFGVFGRRFVSQGLPEGDEFQVNTHTTGNQLRASVAARAQGDFVVAWQSFGQDGSGSGIYGRRFGGDFLFRDGFDAASP